MELFTGYAANISCTDLVGWTIGLVTSTTCGPINKPLLVVLESYDAAVSLICAPTVPALLLSLSSDLVSSPFFLFLSPFLSLVLLLGLTFLFLYCDDVNLANFSIVSG